jgi:hypothetical protein
MDNLTATSARTVETAMPENTISSCWASILVHLWSCGIWYQRKTLREVLRETQPSNVL